jgi:hypothetical protein
MKLHGGDEKITLKKVSQPFRSDAMDVFRPIQTRNSITT